QVCTVCCLLTFRQPESVSYYLPLPDALRIQATTATGVLPGAQDGSLLSSARCGLYLRTAIKNQSGCNCTIRTGFTGSDSDRCSARCAGCVSTEVCPLRVVLAYRDQESISL